MTPDRERIEREAQTIMDELAMPPPRWLGDRIVALVMRERAAAFESAAVDARDALECERKALNAGGYIEACMELERRYRALAAQERAP